MNEGRGAVSGILPSPAWRMLWASEMCGDSPISASKMEEVSWCIIFG